MDFFERMEGVKEGVNRELKIFLDGKDAEASALGAPEGFAETVRNISEFIFRGGKRLRPLLFYRGYELAGGKDKEEALKTAIALEFLHTGLLIHDDVMDRDNVRHGGPSMHYKYETDYGTKLGRGDLQHFGYSMAICAGDAAIAWSYEVLIKNRFEDKMKLEAVSKMFDITTATAMGQMMEASLQIGNDLDEKKIMEIYDLKTARYTIAGPFQLGAIFAGADRAELDYIAGFAIPAGIAYQIQDDILDVFGAQKKTGKPVGADLREGKKTLLIAYAIEHATLEDKEYILSHLGDRDMTEEEIAEIRAIIERSGALEYAKSKIAKMREEAADKLAGGGEELRNKYQSLKEFRVYFSGREQ